MPKSTFFSKRTILSLILSESTVLTLVSEGKIDSFITYIYYI